VGKTVLSMLPAWLMLRGARLPYWQMFVLPWWFAVEPWPSSKAGQVTKFAMRSHALLLPLDRRSQNIAKRKQLSKQAA